MGDEPVPQRLLLSGSKFPCNKLIFSSPAYGDWRMAGTRDSHGASVAYEALCAGGFY